MKLNCDDCAFRCEEAFSRDVRPNAGSQRRGKIYVSRLRTGWERESFVVSQRMDGNNVGVMANDDSGVLYGCPELAKRIRASGKLPEGMDIHDGPK